MNIWVNTNSERNCLGDIENHESISKYGGKDEQSESNRDLTGQTTSQSRPQSSPVVTKAEEVERPST